MKQIEKGLRAKIARLEDMVKDRDKAIEKKNAALKRVWEDIHSMQTTEKILTPAVFVYIADALYSEDVIMEASLSKEWNKIIGGNIDG